jgi:hypothetical protein
MKHIETLPYNDARIMVRSGLEHLQVTHFDMTEKMDCYFCPVSGNLWHCYLGQVDLYNILADTVIAQLEREYAPQPYERMTMFEIEKYKKPTDWAQVALWIVSVAAIVVVLLDLFVWRP